MLADDVAAILATTPGLSVAELATLTNAPSPRAVALALCADHGRFRTERRGDGGGERGSSPRWWLATPPSLGVRVDPAAPSLRAPSTPRGLIGLYAWQVDALEAWRRAGRRGVVEAVTGTGKTMVGIAATVAELDRRGQVLVLVPTVELQQQWGVELARRLPAGTRVGRLGAGVIDSLSTHDVLVAVVNSARAADVRPIRQGGLLVADECHRYGSAMNHLALDGRFSRRLGLSATYAREDDGNEEWLDPYFGGTCFRLGYQRALAEAVTARFTVALIGVRFSPGEQAFYADLTEMMGGLRARLVREFGVPEEPFDAFMQAVNLLADGDGAGAGVARAWRQAMQERRRLLEDTPAKDHALEALSPAVSDAGRAIVFTQSIAASDRACALLRRCGVRAGAVHSALGGEDRRDVLGRFGRGELDALAAPRVLDEGVDVPAADLAVIAGASRSRRQMIQRMGRVLRKKPDGRRARFAIVFVEGTVEDPAHGAHEAFLDEIVTVADGVSLLAAGPSGAAGPNGAFSDALRLALRPSWP